MNITETYLAAHAERTRAAYAAELLSAELGCEVTPSPFVAGRVEARDPAPGTWLLSGPVDEVRVEARRLGLLAWLQVLGSQARYEPAQGRPGRRRRARDDRGREAEAR